MQLKDIGVQYYFPPLKSVLLICNHGLVITRYLQTFHYMLGSCPFDHHELKKIIVTWEFREIRCLMSGSDRLLLQRPLGVVMASLKMPSASKVPSKYMISSFSA